MEIYILIIFFLLVFLVTYIVSCNVLIQRKPRIIITMTTSPRRINHIYKVIGCLQRQTRKPDMFFINLPRVFKRDNSSFSEIPDFLRRDNIKLNFCEDLGPATKIVPTCKSDEIRDNDILISVDDDICYHEEAIETFLKVHSMYPDYVLTGSTLFPLEESDNSTEFVRECQLLEGFSMVLYKKNWLSDIPLEMFDKDVVPLYHYLSDDLVLSNYLVSKGIGILAFKGQHAYNKKVRPLEYGLQEDALHKGAGISDDCKGFKTCNIANYVKTISYLRNIGSYHLAYLEDDVMKL